MRVCTRSARSPASTLEIDLRRVGRPARAQRAAADRHPRARRRRGATRVSRAVSRDGQVLSLSHRRRRRCCRRSIAGSSGTRRAHATSDAMREAAAALVGRHDFASFQARGAFVRGHVAHAHAPRRARGGRRDRRSRSTATGSFATWCAPSSARWPRSARASGRSDVCGAMLAARDRRAAGRRRRRAGSRWRCDTTVQG